jgi:hypothetical protein
VVEIAGDEAVLGRVNEAFMEFVGVLVQCIYLLGCASGRGMVEPVYLPPRRAQGKTPSSQAHDKRERCKTDQLNE